MRTACSPGDLVTLDVSGTYARFTYKVGSGSFSDYFFLAPPKNVCIVVSVLDPSVNDETRFFEDESIIMCPGGTLVYASQSDLTKITCT